MDFEKARHNMIEQQLRPWLVSDPAVIEQLYADRREDFVPEAYRALAFADVEIPVAVGMRGASLLPPKLEGRILQALAVQPHERVLEIGAGSGHMAALLAARAKAVWSVEIDPAVAAIARANLERAGIDNVRVETGDGLAGLPASVANHAPFDAIVVSGGVNEVPRALLDLLAVGGRLAAFVALPGQAPTMALRLFRRNAADAIASADVLETSVPFLKRPPAPRFAF
ncbi:MAG: protein-L-isoaspartate O-methyltransferase [Sulfuritalea sp.]|nr:protein-L-isoaspartate O-methyltransferase [Sulfuritalea sp.]